MGSANDHRNAWSLNYELIWEDDSEDAVEWVEREFDALWNCHEAFPLAEAVIEDVERLARRSVIPMLNDWKNAAIQMQHTDHRNAGLPEGIRPLGTPEIFRPTRVRSASRTVGVHAFSSQTWSALARHYNSRCLQC